MRASCVSFWSSDMTGHSLDVKWELAVTDVISVLRVWCVTLTKTPQTSKKATAVLIAFIHNNSGSTKRDFQRITMMLCLDLHGYTTGFLEQWLVFNILPWWKIYRWLEVWRSRAWEHYKHHAISRHCGGIRMWMGLVRWRMQLRKPVFWKAMLDKGNKAGWRSVTSLFYRWESSAMCGQTAPSADLYYQDMLLHSENIRLEITQIVMGFDPWCCPSAFVIYRLI